MKKLAPLFRLALKSGATDAIALHVRRGESLNGRDMSGLTPLMIAAIHNQHESCSTLLALGADATLRSAAGKTASELAFEHGHHTLAAVLGAPRGSSNGVPQAAQVVAQSPASFRDSCTIDVRPQPVRESGGWESATTSENDDPGPHTLAIADPSAAEEQFGGWVADDAGAPPVHDATCVAAASEAQRRLSEHRRVSDEFDWSDVEFELPAAHVAVQAPQRYDLGAIRGLVAAGLQMGYVSALDLHMALQKDWGHEPERGQAVLERLLDDLGVLIEAGGWSHQVDVVTDDDELREAMLALNDELDEPVITASTFVARARQYDLVKRDDEERIGRRMDSALGALTRALASLSDADWQLAFPPQPGRGVAASGEIEEDEALEATETIASEEAEDEPEEAPGDYRAYVERVRRGESEHGRDAAVPRPTAPQLKHLLDFTTDMTGAVTDAIRSSIAGYETARDRLVTANLRLAASVAHNYRFSELPLEDLIQEANIGLLRAAEGYDFRRGFKFSTYATWWIRQAVMRSIADTSRAIRVPVHQVEKINLVNRARRELEFGHVGEVSALEIAARLSLPPDQVRRIMLTDARTVSLEECGPGLTQDTPAPYNIVDAADGPWERACARSLQVTVQRMLEDLDPRARDVIVARFGFDGEGGRTLEEVGQQFNVTRERIRQIEATALGKLRHRSRLDILVSFAPTVRAQRNCEDK